MPSVGRVVTPVFIFFRRAATAFRLSFRYIAVATLWLLMAAAVRVLHPHRIDEMPGLGMYFAFVAASVCIVMHGVKDTPLFPKHHYVRYPIPVPD